MTGGRSWRKLLEAEMKYQDDPGPVVAYAPDEAAFDVPARKSWDLPSEVAAWTETRVYFEQFDEAEKWISSALRNPPDGVDMSDVGRSR